MRLIERAQPLRSTLIAAGLLLALPALLLGLFPRRLATGLDRLQADAALLQSFTARPGDPPPPLWQQRLGPGAAQALWARQRRLWWQFWGPHGDAGSYLVLPAVAGQPAPAGALPHQHRCSRAALAAQPGPDSVSPRGAGEVRRGRGALARCRRAAYW